VAYLTRIEINPPGTLTEFLKVLKNAANACDFSPHISDTREPPFLTEGFSNDFAQWVLASAIATNWRSNWPHWTFETIFRLQSCGPFAARVNGYCTQYPNYAGQEALERFYFCEGVEVTNRWAYQHARCAKFREGIERLSHAHFTFTSYPRGCGCICAQTIFDLAVKQPGLETLANQREPDRRVHKHAGQCTSSLVRLIELEEKKG